MAKALFDTGVIISLCDREDKERKTKASHLYGILKKNGFEVCFSERSKNELLIKPSESRIHFLEIHPMVSYFIGNETWDQIEGSWENLSSDWNTSDIESEIHERIGNWLRRNRDLQDKGILLDAILNKCKLFVHENPKDYNRVPYEFWSEFGLVEIDLLNDPIEKILKTAANNG